MGWNMGMNRDMDRDGNRDTALCAFEMYICPTGRYIVDHSVPSQLPTGSDCLGLL